MKISSLRSIYRVNVRFVTVVCLLCALAAACWVAWRLSEWQPRLPVNRSTALAAPLPVGEWRRSDGQEADWAEASPFTSPYLEARLAEAAAARAAAEARKAREAEARAAAARAAQARKAAQPPPQAAVPEKVKPVTPVPPPKPPPKPRTITLVYRGLLTHTDGTQVAIIEQIENGKTALLKQGATLEGFQMTRLDRTTAMLSTADGKQEHALPVGKRITLTPDKNKQ